MNESRQQHPAIPRLPSDAHLNRPQCAHGVMSVLHVPRIPASYGMVTLDQKWASLPPKVPFGQVRALLRA